MFLKGASWKTVLAGAMLAGALLLGGVSPAQARDTCYERIRRAQWKLERDIERHGYYSRQADHRRRELWKVRQRCGGANRWRQQGWDDDNARRHGKWHSFQNNRERD